MSKKDKRGKCLTTEEGGVLQYVPHRLKTLELCIAAVKNDGRVLWYVPESLKTQELYLLAVQNDDRALQYVPKTLRDTCRRRITLTVGEGFACRYAGNSQK